MFKNILTGPVEESKLVSRPPTSHIPLLQQAALRLAPMYLLATGLLAMLVAIYSNSPDVSFSCALCAAVNAVAALHYALICERQPRARSGHRSCQCARRRVYEDVR